MVNLKCVYRILIFLTFYFVSRFSTEDISINDGPLLGPKLPARITTRSEDLSNVFSQSVFRDFRINSSELLTGLMNSA